MLLIGIVLLVVGFLFPPAWLGIAGVAIYWFASRKSRRDEAVENRVRKMVRAKQSYGDFPELYFEAARAYAIAKGGGTNGDEHSASLTMVADGLPFFVVFTRVPGGGTTISVSESDRVRAQVLTFADSHTDPVAEETEHGIVGSLRTSRKIPPDVERAVGKAIEAGERKSPTWRDDDAILDTLVNEALKAAMDAGMPEMDARVWFQMQSKELADIIMTAAACFEEQGYGVPEQIAGASEVFRRFASVVQKGMKARGLKFPRTL